MSVTLYFATTDIAYRYAPDPPVPNPEHVAIDEVLKNHRHEHDKLTLELGDKRGHLKKLSDQRRMFINKAVSKYASLRMQYDRSSLNSELYSDKESQDE